mmetsp:Transcript_61539/g.183378  ORF Transcript_61539/g.183378 Transcript_61539/m.183378 type:complete len:253 (+) Transcript_61539:185-943(+)
MAASGGQPPGRVLQALLPGGDRGHEGQQGGQEVEDQGAVAGGLHAGASGPQRRRVEPEKANTRDYDEGWRGEKQPADRLELLPDTCGGPQSDDQPVLRGETTEAVEDEGNFPRYCSAADGRESGVEHHVQNRFERLEVDCRGGGAGAEHRARRCPALARHGGRVPDADCHSCAGPHRHPALPRPSRQQRPARGLPAPAQQGGQAVDADSTGQSRFLPAQAHGEQRGPDRPPQVFEQPRDATEEDDGCQAPGA